MSELLLGNSLKFGVADTPTREGEVVQKFEDIYNIPTPVVGMSVFVRETEKSYIVKSLKKENVGGKEVYTKVDEVICTEEEIETIKTENAGRDAEISANKVKVNALTNSLNSEVTRAQEAEAALNDLINGEGSNAKYSTRFIGVFNNFSDLLAGIDSLIYDESQEDKNLGSFRALLNQRIVEIKNVSLVRSGSSLVQVVSGPFEESNGSLSLSSTEYGIFSRIHDTTWSKWKRLTTTMGEVNAAISAAIAALIDKAPENLDTLKEIADWIEEHGGEVEAIYKAIESNTKKIDAEQRRAEQAEKELREHIERVNNSAVAIDGTQVTATSDDVYIEFDSLGENSESITLPSATTTKAGVMSAEDKKALDTATSRALRALFVAAGAEYNDSGTDKTKTAPWGETVTHKAGCYYLNGLGDITEEQMLRIYNAPHNGIYAGAYQGANIRTAFLKRTGAQRPLTSINLDNWFNESSVEVVGVNGLLYTRSASFVRSFSDCTRLKHILFNPIVCSSGIVINMFSNCTQLQTVKLRDLSENLSFAHSSNLLKEGVIYTIQQAIPKTAITITLHPDAYARLADDADIIAALEAQPLITLVSA